MPACHPGQFCHRQFDVALHESPTRRQCDPEINVFQVLPDDPGESGIRVRRPWKGKDKAHVFVRTVILSARVDELVQAFPYDGELRIVSENGHTSCSLKSPAPILWLDPTSPFMQTERVPADEVKTLLAERGELWEEEHPKADFDKRLAETDPSRRDAAGIHTLQKSVARFPKPLPELMVEFSQYLQGESRPSKETHWSRTIPPDFSIVVIPKDV